MITLNELLERARHIQLLILDVDGVLSDGKIYLSDNQVELKAFHVHDGLGIKLVQQAGITVAVISSRNSSLVTQRMQALGVSHIYQGQANKLPTYEKLLQELAITTQQTAYIGDDLPDVPLLERAGLGITVANAHSCAKQVAVWQTQLSGGNGAVREICDLLIQARTQ